MVRWILSTKNFSVSLNLCRQFLTQNFSSSFKIGYLKSLLTHAVKHLYFNYSTLIPFVIQVSFVGRCESETFDVDLLFDHFFWILLLFYYNLRLDFILVMKGFSVNYNFIRFDELLNLMLACRIANVSLSVK
jgi:hypothetical protein